MERWEDVAEFLRAEAEHDLRTHDELAPCLVAFAGPQPLLCAFMRPFEKGAYHDPLIELIALAMPLGADRLALSLAGRAWSLDDPLPPVIPGEGDLRQRVFTVTCVDGTAGRPRALGTLWPFTVTPQGVQWGEAVISQQLQVGWICDALTVAVRDRRRISGSLTDIREQAQRCAARGHDVYLHPTVQSRLGLPATCS